MKRLAAGLVLGGVVAAGGLGLTQAQAHPAGTTTVMWHRPHVNPRFPQWLGSHAASPDAICQKDTYRTDTPAHRATVRKLISGGVLRLVHGVPADSTVYITSTTGPCQGGTPSTPRSSTTTPTAPTTTASRSATTVPSSPSSATARTPTAATSTSTTGIPSTGQTAPPGTSSLAPPLTISRHRKTTVGASTRATVTTSTATSTADTRSSGRTATSGLPYTGSNAGPLAGLAAALLLGGGALAYAGRKRGEHR